ncbi:DUF6153 family protein [Streptomyces sp. NPDC004267]|uniref:DUF6153 family protein n=1 Tax=Streptomyces sp. NPDC004267 TaxID=3364694 RepID=UPI0036A4C987
MHTGRERSVGGRAGGALARLLLVVVLALGVFVMHSVGHPEGSAAMDGGTMTHSAAPAHADGPATGSAHHSSPAPSSPSSHDSGTGMDMTTLCVAVLGAWLLAALVRAALARRPDRITPLLARLRPALGPNAPPRPPDLARLSVLRI